MVIELVHCINTVHFENYEKNQLGFGADVKGKKNKSVVEKFWYLNLDPKTMTLEISRLSIPKEKKKQMCCSIIDVLVLFVIFVTLASFSPRENTINSSFGLASHRSASISSMYM